MALNEHGEMLIHIKGKVDDFNRKYDQVISKGEQMKQKFAQIAKFIAGAYVAGRIISALKKILGTTLELGVELDRLSKQWGMNVIEIQRLQYAAQMANVDFNNMKTIIPILSQYMVQAQIGMGTYVDNFDRLGITVTDSEGKLKSAYDVILEMSDYMKTDAANATEKLGNLKQLLGRRGAELIPLLMEEREQLEAWGDEAEALAGTLSEEMVKSLVLANRNLKELNATTQGLKIQLGVGLIPQVDIYAKALGNLLGVTSDVNQEKMKLKNVLIDIATLLGNPIAMFFKLKERVRELKDENKVLITVLEATPDPLDDIKNALAGKNKKLAEQIELDKEEIALLDTLSGATKRTGGEFRSLAEIWAVDTSDAGSGLVRIIGDLEDGTKDWSKQTKILGDMLGKVLTKGIDAATVMKSLMAAGLKFGISKMGGGFFKDLLGGIFGMGEGGIHMARAAEGLVTAPAISPGGAFINDNRKTVPETVLTSQELQQLIYGLSHPTVNIYKAGPESYVDVLLNIPESIKYKLARFMSDEILNKTEALNE